MRSLKKLNQAAGTGFTRWAQVVAVLRQHYGTVGGKKVGATAPKNP